MPEITVGTLNLFNRQASWPRRARLVIDQFLEHRPDVMAFQEVDHGLDQANWLCWWINSELGAPEYEAIHAFNPLGVFGFESLAVLSRLPFLEHEVLDYRSYNTIAQRVRIGLEAGSSFDLYHTHLYYVPTREGSAIRQEEAEKLLRWMDLHGDDAPRVIVGDFNSRPDGRTAGMMKKLFRSSFEVVHGSDPERTWPSPMAYTLNATRVWGFPVEQIPGEFFGCLDYIFVDDRVEVRDAAVAFNRADQLDETLYPSDHFGVVARLGL